MRGSVVVVDRNGASRTLATGLVHASGIAWSGSGDEVLFTGSHERSTDNYLSAVSLSGDERVLARAPANFFLMDMTSGGRGLFRTNLASTPILFLGPGDRRERDLSELDLSYVVDLSRDGRTLLGVEQGAGVGKHGAIFLRPTDGAPAVWLGEGDPLALSPDGKWILTRRIYLSPPEARARAHRRRPGPRARSGARGTVPGRQVVPGWEADPVFRDRARTRGAALRAGPGRRQAAGRGSRRLAPAVVRRGGLAGWHPHDRPRSGLGHPRSIPSGARRSHRFPASDPVTTRSAGATTEEGSSSTGPQLPPLPSSGWMSPAAGPVSSASCCHRLRTGCSASIASSPRPTAGRLPTTISANRTISTWARVSDQAVA